MATIDSKKLIDEIITNNGNYYDDPPVLKIVQYTNKWGKTAWGVIYRQHEMSRYNSSEFVINPQTIFERK